MKGKGIRKLSENKRLVRTSCGLLAAVVLFGGGLYLYDSQNTVMELPVVTDGEVIVEEEVPLAAAPKVTKQTKTKKSTKTVKIKKPSKKSYTKKLPTKKKTSTVTKKSADKTVKTQTQTTTSTVEKYTKKQKKKKVTTTTKTVTTTTTTIVNATATKAAKKTTAAPAKAVVKKNLDVNSSLPKADAKLRNAFIKLGFTIKVDSTVSYTGRFDAASRSITMVEEKNDAIYHELGHFLMFMYVANKANDGGSEGQAAYAAEKNLYTGVQKAYVTSGASEYLAESYRDYCMNPTALKNSRPQTYALIEKALKAVTDSKVATYKRVYGW